MALARIETVPQGITTLSTEWLSGPITLNQFYCVDSVRGSGGPPPGKGPPGGPPGQVRPYQVTLTTPAPLALASGNETLPVTLTWRDINRNQSYTLTPGATTPLELQGASPCDNAEFVLSIGESDLVTAQPGIYSRDFYLTLSQNAGDADPPTEVDLVIQVSVDVPDRIRVSGFTDFNLGTFNGSDDLQASDGLCVFRASGGNYRVKIWGDGPNNGFYLTGNAAQLPYRVAWNNQLVAANQLLSSQAAGSFGGNDACAGQTNATLDVRVLSSDALATPYGTYTGVLTVLVEME